MGRSGGDDPGRGTWHLARPALVGRDRELAELTGALAQPPATVLVAGEAGVGKSRLLRECLAADAVEGQRVLFAVCPPFPETLTLGSVVDAIRDLGGDPNGGSPSPLAGALRPLFPEWAAVLPPAPDPLEDADASRHRLLRALVELLTQFGVDLLVVEDAQWADEATVELLLMLASRPSPPVSLAVTYRPEEVAHRALLRRLHTGVRISLGPLDACGTGALVSSMVGGGPVSDEFAAFLHERTEGLPLAVEESVWLLRDRADVVYRDGEWMRRHLPSLQVPPSVRDSVLDRSQRVGPHTRAVLEAAAVLAEPASEGLLTEVAGLASPSTADGFADALGTGLLVEDQRGQVSFRHALAGQAVYEVLAGPQRRLLHQRAASALERVDPKPIDQLLRHHRSAGDLEGWCRYAEQVAWRAVADDHHVVAVRVLTELLEQSGLPVDARARIACTLAGAAASRADVVDDWHRRAAAAVRSVLDTAALTVHQEAAIRQAFGRMLFQLDDDVVGRLQWETAAEQLAHDPVAACRVMTHLGLPTVGHHPRSVYGRWLRRAAALVPRVPAGAEQLAVRADLAHALLLLGDERGWSLAGALPTAADTSREQRELARGFANISSSGMRWGRYAEVGRHLAIAAGLLDRSGFPRLTGRVSGLRATLDWLTGAWRGLAETIAALRQEASSPPMQLDHTMFELRYRWCRGAVAEAEVVERLGRLADESRRSSAIFREAEARSWLARIDLDHGRADEVVRDTADIVGDLAARGLLFWADSLLPARTEALAATGRVAEAEELVAQFARETRGRTAPALRASLGLCRAVLLQASGDRHAAASFGRVARAWDRLPQPYDALLARERQARCLIEGELVETGLDLLNSVYTGLAELGADRDADRIAHRLAEHGVRLRRRVRGRPSYGDQLSPREREVVELVAAGHTNNEIARLLSKSPWTVARQVRSAMGKLRVLSRAALAARVGEDAAVGADR